VQFLGEPSVKKTKTVAPAAAKRGNKSGGLSDARLVPPPAVQPPPAPAAAVVVSAEVAAKRTSAAKQAWATRRALNPEKFPMPGQPKAPAAAAVQPPPPAPAVLKSASRKPKHEPAAVLTALSSALRQASTRTRSGRR
jgi:hypothetical protein